MLPCNGGNNLSWCCSFVDERHTVAMRRESPVSCVVPRRRFEIASQCYLAWAVGTSLLGDWFHRAQLSLFECRSTRNLIFTSEVPNEDLSGDRRLSAVLAIGIFVEQALPRLHGYSKRLPPGIYLQSKGNRASGRGTHLPGVWLCEPQTGHLSCAQMLSSTKVSTSLGFFARVVVGFFFGAGLLWYAVDVTGNLRNLSGACTSFCKGRTDSAVVPGTRNVFGTREFGR